MRNLFNNSEKLTGETLFTLLSDAKNNDNVFAFLHKKLEKYFLNEIYTDYLTVNKQDNMYDFDDIKSIFMTAYWNAINSFKFINDVKKNKKLIKYLKSTWMSYLKKNYKYELFNKIYATNLRRRKKYNITIDSFSKLNILSDNQMTDDDYINNSFNYKNLLSDNSITDETIYIEKIFIDNMFDALYNKYNLNKKVHKRMRNLILYVKNIYLYTTKFDYKKISKKLKVSHTEIYYYFNLLKKDIKYYIQNNKN